MVEYIEREALKKVLNRYLNAPHVMSRNSISQGMRVAIKSCIELVGNEPTADVAPVRHGRWGWDSGDVYICTRCGEKSHVKEVMGNPTWDWCPNCGALMDGGDDNG